MQPCLVGPSMGQPSAPTLAVAALFALLTVACGEGSRRSAGSDDVPAPYLLPTPAPEMEEPQEIPEFFTPDLMRPELKPLEMDPVPFLIELNPRMLSGPQVALKRFYELGELDHPPRPLVKMPPVYPYKAKRLEIEGYVKIKFLVDEEGTVSRVSVLEASPKGVFEDSVLQTLPSWKFSPGRVVGEPVSSWVVTTIRFELK